MMNDYTGYNMAPDLMENIKDLNKDGKGKNVYVLIAEGQLRASTTKYDLTKHLEGDDPIAKPGDDAEIKCLYGIVLDIHSLPYEIPEHISKTKDIYIIIGTDNEFDVETTDTVEDAAESIAAILGMNKDLAIEDCVVMIGEEIPIAYSLAKTGDSISAFQVMGN